MNENQNWCQEEREVIRTGNSQKDIHWENVCLFMNSEKYCGIIRIRGGSVFVEFVGNPHPRIYIVNETIRSKHFIKH